MLLLEWEDALWFYTTKLKIKETNYIHTAWYNLQLLFPSRSFLDHQNSMISVNYEYLWRPSLLLESFYPLLITPSPKPKLKFSIKNIREYEKLTLCSLSPIKQTDLSVGTHLLNSLIQLCNVDLGTKTIWGPGMFL